jgi:hypothetical protein
MESDRTPKSEKALHPTDAAKHVASARELLTELHKKANWSDRHPELQQAITELEMALNILTIKTGAML